MKLLSIKVAAIYATFFASIPLTLRAETCSQTNQLNETRQQYFDVATSIVYGADDNIYVAGYNWNLITYGDWYVISIDTTGNSNWVYCYNGPANWQDMGYSIVYGGDSNIYSAGYSTHSPENWDFTVLSLTTAGDTNWMYRYNSPGYIYEWASSIIYGSDSNIYAGGYVEGNAYDIGKLMIVSLTQKGDTNWTYQYNNHNNSLDIANAIAYGSDSNIYACGYTNGSGYDRDIFAISLTTLGDINWTYTYNGSANWSDEVYSIAYGLDGNIYIAGHCTGIGTNKDLIVISLNASGDTNWTYTYDGPIHGDDWASSICYGADGNIYAVGSCSDSAQWWVEKNFIVVSLTSSGAENWVYVYDGGDSEDQASSVVYGTDGNIYAGGYSSGYDALIISFATTGDTNWTYEYNGPGNAEDKIYAIVYGTDGNIYGAGSSWGINNDDIIVISLTPSGNANWIYRYDGSPGVEEDNNYHQTVLSSNTIQICPNPCSRSTTLAFNISRLNTPTSLCLYDINGRLCDVIWQGNRQLPASFKYRLSDNLASGIYFFVLEVANTRYTKRLIVVR